MDDGLTASTEAVERLRQALISRGDVSGALRDLAFRNPALLAGVEASLAGLAQSGLTRPLPPGSAQIVFDAARA